MVCHCLPRFLVGGGATGAAFYGLGYAHSGATAQDNNQFRMCTSNHAAYQVAAFIQTVITAPEGDTGGNNAAEIKITLPNNHVLSISARAYPKSKGTPPPQCEAAGPQLRLLSKGSAMELNICRRFGIVVD